MGRQNENHNHRTLPKLITWITTLWNLMKLWGMPCSVTQDGWGHGGEFWQNMVHWKREWQTTSAFLSWEPHEQHEKEKRYHMERWKPRLLGAQYTTREERRNSSWRNEEAESKQKWHPAVDVTGGESKVWWCKEQYCYWKVRTEILRVYQGTRVRNGPWWPSSCRGLEDNSVSIGEQSGESMMFLG